MREHELAAAMAHLDGRAHDVDRHHHDRARRGPGAGKELDDVGTSPLSMRRRSASVLRRSDPVSTTWTTPYDVSMARSAAASDSEGAVFAARKTSPVKWT